MLVKQYSRLRLNFTFVQHASYHSHRKISLIRKINTKIMSYHKTITKLTSLEQADVKKFIDSFDTVLTDCDGVLWMDNKPLPNSPQVMNAFRSMGKKVFFVTNNSTKVKEDFINKAKNLGYICNEEEMISTAYLAAKYLKERNVNKAYVVGSRGITEELTKVGIEHLPIGPDVLTCSIGEYLKDFKIDPEVGAVVVGFDEHISYIKFTKAASYLANKNCHFVATNTDESFPVENNFVIPGTGTFVTAIATCSGREPVVLGKPNPFIVKALMDEHNICPERTLMIGDRCNTDIQLGSNCGFQTLLVLTGVSKLEDVKEYKQKADCEGLIPDVYLNKLGDLLPYLQ